MLMWITSLNMGGGPAAPSGVLSPLVGFIRNLGTLMTRR